MTAGGFRPLTGIKVSEPRYSMANSISYVVSVPSRGLRYLNYILCRVLIHIQHIALCVSKSAFPIVITYNIIP